MELKKDIIDVRNLCKCYKYTTKNYKKGLIHNLFKREKKLKYALNNFSITIRSGEVVGIIGPNGAGKTTLTKLLSGIIHPTSGEINVLNYTPYHLQDSFKRKIALVMGQKTQLWWDLSVIDTFLLNKVLYEIPDDTFKENLDFFSSLMGVKDLLNKQARQLSLGERMKMELISCLLHNPTLLFLDEPTIGLDLIAQKNTRQYLKEINSNKNTTILLTSHYLDDIEHLCDRVVIINNGLKIYDGPIESLTKNHGGMKYISITFNSPQHKSEYFNQKGVDVIEDAPQFVKLRVDPKEVTNILKTIVNNYEVSDLKIVDEPIENIIENIYVNGMK